MPQICQTFQKIQHRKSLRTKKQDRLYTTPSGFHNCHPVWIKLPYRVFCFHSWTKQNMNSKEKCEFTIRLSYLIQGHKIQTTLVHFYIFVIEDGTRQFLNVSGNSVELRKVWEQHLLIFHKEKYSKVKN